MDDCNMLISVVIPAHNAERTIMTAIQSIEAALDGKAEYEIIVVENMSEDETSRVIQNAGKSKVKLLHSEKGVSNARNAGIKAASGRWIMFVDADDSVLPDSELVKTAQNSKADLCLFGYEVGREKRQITENVRNIKEPDVEKFIIEMLESPTKYMQVWAKLFRKSSIDSRGMSFEASLRLAEDSDFTLRFAKCCKAIDIYPGIMYHYTINSASAMHTYDGKKVRDYEHSMIKSYEAVKDGSEQLQKGFWEYVLTHFHIAMVNETFSAANKQSFREKVAGMRSCAEKGIYKQAIENTSIHSGPKINRLVGELLRRKMYIAAGLIYKLRADQKAKGGKSRNEENTCIRND